MQPAHQTLLLAGVWGAAARHDALVDLIREQSAAGGRSLGARSERERLLWLAQQVDEGAMHARRVGGIAAAVAASLGMDPTFVLRIGAAAPLHDVGKVEVSRQILDKPGPLTPRERRAVERHVVLGERLCRAANDPLLALAADIARWHHERWDGMGYPDRLRGEEIPLAARIVAVVDVYDALISVRPYKPAWSVLRARRYLQAGAGRAFDPQVVRAFLALPPVALGPLS